VSVLSFGCGSMRELGGIPGGELPAVGLAVAAAVVLAALLALCAQSKASEPDEKQTSGFGSTTITADTHSSKYSPLLRESPMPYSAIPPGMPGSVSHYSAQAHVPYGIPFEPDPGVCWLRTRAQLAASATRTHL
jgi:hypothetical protein